MNYLSFILLFLALSGNAGTEVGYGGDPQPIEAMSLSEAKESLGLSPNIIVDALDVISLRLRDKQSTFPNDMVVALKKELRFIRVNRSKVIKVIKEDAIPITRIVRCGYKKLVKVSAFTGNLPSSPIYFSKNFLLGNSEKTLAQILFHEVFRHIAGERLNCMDDTIHQISQFVFGQKSTMTKKKVKAYWTLKGVSLHYNLIRGFHSVAETRIIFDMYKNNENIVYFDVARDKEVLKSAISNVYPNIKLTREIFHWYLDKEIKSRKNLLDRLMILLHTIDDVVDSLVNYELSEERERRFISSLVAIHKHWGYCPRITIAHLETLASKKSITRTAKNKILALKQRLRRNRRLRGIRIKDCSSDW